MHPLIIQRIATTTIMPLVAASGFAGYSYYQTPNYQTPIQVQQVCTVLSFDVPTQSTSQNDVLMLQRFLVARGYVQGSVNGQFGQATLVGLQRFQADNGIPVTGVADWQTRTLIQQVSCVTVPPPVYPPPVYPPQYPGTNNQLSVQGIDAPSSLAVGQSGSWSVHVLSYQGSGQLHYAVTWGDENNGVRYAASAYPAAPVQGSGTFTHTYTRPGTYNATFTVTDGYGHQAQTSATTHVSAAPVYPTTYPNTTYPNTGYTYPNSSYCTTYAGQYDRSCITRPPSTYPPYPSYGTTNYPSGCTSYYDRACYVNGQYVGPSYGAGSTYNGPGDTCYFMNGQWQGNCGGTASSGYMNNGYVNSGSGNTGYGNSWSNTNSTDYSCYYDRACLAALQGRSY
ncbi:MAG: hypothetical protein JWO84_708 [Parcubacteria group bacterium]|nr:hypothetical protein [Parcubacteria group bacterium]